MSQMTFFEFHSLRAKEFSMPQPFGYGRARLWLGITAVGTIVTVASLGLICDAASRYERLTASFQWRAEVSLLIFIDSSDSIFLCRSSFSDCFEQSLRTV